MWKKVLELVFCVSWTLWVREVKPWCRCRGVKRGPGQGGNILRKLYGQGIVHIPDLVAKTKRHSEWWGNVIGGDEKKVARNVLWNLCAVFVFASTKRFRWKHERVVHVADLQTKFLITTAEAFHELGNHSGCDAVPTSPPARPIRPIRHHNWSRLCWTHNIPSLLAKWTRLLSGFKVLLANPRYHC
jgi:hypothetical protein